MSKIRIVRAMNSPVHETGEQRHAGNRDHGGLGIDPRSHPHLENLHDRADDMIDEDDLDLIPAFQFEAQEQYLYRQGRNKQEVVAVDRPIGLPDEFAGDQQ